MHELAYRVMPAPQPFAHTVGHPRCERLTEAGLLVGDVDAMMEANVGGVPWQKHEPRSPSRCLESSYSMRCSRWSFRNDVSASPSAGNGFSGGDRIYIWPMSHLTPYYAFAHI